MERGFSVALSRWRDILEPGRISIDPETRALAERATYAHTRVVQAVLRPGSVAQVQAVLRVATETGVPVHVASTGRNWGLGSRLPVRSPSVLLSLSDLDRILAFDARLGTITVQPGVSFAGVDAFLEEQGAGLYLAPTGGPAEGSPLANALERGDGYGPLGARADAIAGLEVVLPTGEIVRTGYRRFPGSALSGTHKHGVGPMLDGLFTQSNLGIVTEATLWLQPKPACFQGFSCVPKADGGLAGLLDAAQPLVLSGTLPPCTLTAWNRHKRAAMAMTFPTTRGDGASPPTAAASAGFPPWMVSGSLHADSFAIGRAQRDLVRDRLGPHGDGLTFYDAENPPRGQAGRFPSYVSSGINPRTAYWRKPALPEGPPFDVEADRCGVLWLCPGAPFRGEDVARAATTSETRADRHGFEAHVGLVAMSGRAVNLFVALMFDLDVAGESDRAMACHDEMMAALVADGCLPYRLGVQSMAAPPPAEGAYDAVLGRIRRVMDPSGILAPGRYEFGDVCSAPAPATGSDDGRASPARANRRESRP